MEDGYYILGSALSDLDGNRLQHEDSRRLLSAAQEHPAFDVVELRRIEIDAGDGQAPKVADGIVVECCDGTVPTRNAVGIKNRERLLLLHGPTLLTPHEVRALRGDFPITAHQNAVRDDEPVSLCLYFEPWSAVERTWTPAKHLQRILWWLRETALGTLHRSDQPLERLHFVSPHQIVLPADFGERAAGNTDVLRLTRAQSRNTGTVVRGTFQPKPAALAQANDTGLDSLIVAVPTVVATRIERYPATLGALHDQLMRYGSELLSPLIDAAKGALPSTGLPIRDRTAQHTLLLLRMPLARNENDAPERIDVSGFIVHDASLAQLGIACGAYFDGTDGKAYQARDIGLTGTDAVPAANCESWRQLTVEPVDVRVAFSPSDARRASGISDEGADFHGVLAGVGALGSSMAELWSREGWGAWSYVDDDILHAHNIVRHAGKDMHIGWAKVDVSLHLAGLNWPMAPKPHAIAAKVSDFDNPEVWDVVSGASIVVDATTTLDVPRDLSDLDGAPRIASAFLTPSGFGSVLLLEDAERTIRLSSLEAQYYRAILNCDWGSAHLRGHQGSYWVGAGCRDLSGILSQEVVQLHAATLARQIRVLSAQPEAQIRVWSLDEQSGSLAADILRAEKPSVLHLGEWDIIWDEGLETRLTELRRTGLPAETGGVVLGYVDQKRKAIQVVDVLPAPVDSVASQTGFTRGVVGLKEALERASALTANIVGYLGEWHSHPRQSSSMPSIDDAKLLAHLAETLAMDGVPALMIIVGETDISISLGEGATA